MITGFASNGIVACVPAPYELLKDAPPRRLDEDEGNSSREKRIPGWSAAEAKLREYWSLLGFEQLPNSDVFALSLTTRRPPLKSIIRKYLARNERQARSRK